jgi:hypothetical protein
LFFVYVVWLEFIGMGRLQAHWAGLGVLAVPFFESPPWCRRPLAMNIRRCMTQLFSPWQLGNTSRTQAGAFFSASAVCRSHTKLVVSPNA